ncbi:MAG: hypothetical protein ABI718_00345 [Acidobacteriota bacterium]
MKASVERITPQGTIRFLSPVPFVWDPEHIIIGPDGLPWVGSGTRTPAEIMEIDRSVRFRPVGYGLSWPEVLQSAESCNLLVQ